MMKSEYETLMEQNISWRKEIEMLKAQIDPLKHQLSMN